VESIRVLLADDHALVRAGIRRLLESLPDVQVVAETGDGRTALQLIETYEPDVALLDISMPELNGLDTAVRVVREHPLVRVIILSMHASEEYVLRALASGVAGYMLKDAAISELEVAVRAVARGDTYLSPRVSNYVVGDYVRRLGAATYAEPLTPRQREVLQLIAEGRTTKEIAQRLDLSVKTVETHRTQLMQRLDIHDVAGLVRYAIRTGLVASGG
jgi:DNA-binding NarL/FixJ family response regulator